MQMDPGDLWEGFSALVKSFTMTSAACVLRNTPKT